MRFLSMLSFLGLIAFIGFSAVGRGDVYYEEPDSPCNECEVYEEYDETIDPQVIINNTNITNYTWVQINNDRAYHGHPVPHPHYRPYPPAVVPYPYARPICRIGRVGWSHWFDLWVGNRLFQRSSYQVVLNTYWYLARTGQCIPR